MTMWTRQHQRVKHIHLDGPVDAAAIEKVKQELMDDRDFKEIRIHVPPETATDDKKGY